MREGEAVPISGEDGMQHDRRGNSLMDARVHGIDNMDWDCLCRHCNKVVANYVSTASEISGTPHSIMFGLSILSEWNFELW